MGGDQVRHSAELALENFRRRHLNLACPFGLVQERAVHSISTDLVQSRPRVTAPHAGVNMGIGAPSVGAHLIFTA